MRTPSGKNSKKSMVLSYEVLDVAQPEGRMWAKKLIIRAVPSTIIDGKLAFVGVPSEEEARRAIES